MVQSVEQNGAVYVDPAILAALPDVTEIIDIIDVAETRWAKATCLQVRRSDGSEESYFIKVSIGIHGREALKGEFLNTLEMHSVNNDLCPKPIAWGTFETDEDSHFYMCKYYNFNEDLPPVEDFCRMMADLHSNSVSPNGMFGFHCPTYNGDVPQDNSWCDSWEIFFSRGLRHILDLRDERSGSDPELDAMLPELFDRVIPRLLRPLETEGRKIKPCLVHGDLWYGNVSVDDDTGRPIIYDPSGFWGHHEYELGNWRPSRNKLADYISMYYKYIEPSEPAEDLDGRNLLYSLRFNANAATHFPNENMIKDDVRELLRRYPHGCLPPKEVEDELHRLPQPDETKDQLISAF